MNYQLLLKTLLLIGALVDLTWAHDLFPIGKQVGEVS